jgi:hypothetical protein
VSPKRRLLVVLATVGSRGDRQVRDGMVPFFIPPAEFTKTIAVEREQWLAVAGTSGSSAKVEGGEGSSPDLNPTLRHSCERGNPVQA